MNRFLIPALAAFAFVGACASTPPVVTSVGPAPQLEGKLGKEWSRTAKSIQKGEKLVAEGRADLDKGEEKVRKATKALRKAEDQVADAKASVRKGQRLIDDGKARLTQIEAQAGTAAQDTQDPSGS